MGMNTSDIRDMEYEQWVFWAVALPLTIVIILASMWWIGQLPSLTSSLTWLKARSSSRRDPAPRPQPAVAELVYKSYDPFGRQRSDLRRKGHQYNADPKPGVMRYGKVQPFRDGALLIQTLSVGSGRSICPNLKASRSLKAIHNAATIFLELIERYWRGCRGLMLRRAIYNPSSIHVRNIYRTSALC